MKRWIAALLAVMMLCLCGCSGNGGKASVSGSTWVTYRGEGGRVKNGENRDIFVYSYQQPVLAGNGSGVHVINTKLDNATTAFLYGSGGVEEMSELAKMDWKETWFTCYALERKVTVARVDDAVVSFRYSDYVFNGGVHGNTYESGMTYDMVSGSHMSLANLGKDENALKLVCRQHILALLGTEDYPEKDQLMEGYEENLDIVLKNWVLTDEGLQFIAQPYIISTYAAGTLRFTVPYEKLVHVMDEKWIPAAHSHGGGTVTVTTVDSDEPGATNFVLDSDGENMLVKVNGKLYDFSLERINSYRQNGKTVYYVISQLLYSPMISNESFGVQCLVSETEPNVLLRYHDGSGKEYQYLLTYNGVNGGVQLVEPESMIPTI